MVRCPDALLNDTGMPGYFWPLNDATTMDGAYYYLYYKLNDGIRIVGELITQVPGPEAGMAVGVGGVLAKVGQKTPASSVATRCGTTDYYSGPAPSAAGADISCPWSDWGL